MNTYTKILLMQILNQRVDNAKEDYVAWSSARDIVKYALADNIECLSQFDTSTDPLYFWDLKIGDKFAVSAFPDRTFIKTETREVDAFYGGYWNAVSVEDDYHYGFGALEEVIKL